MILSAAMRLDWLGRGHNFQPAVDAGSALTMAVEAAFATGRLHAMKTGGQSDLKTIADAITDALALSRCLPGPSGCCCCRPG